MPEATIKYPAIVNDRHERLRDGLFFVKECHEQFYEIVPEIEYQEFLEANEEAEEKFKFDVIVAEVRRQQKLAANKRDYELKKGFRKRVASSHKVENRFFGYDRRSRNISL